jgi:hypothetical protein
LNDLCTHVGLLSNSWTVAKIALRNHTEPRNKHYFCTWTVFPCRAIGFSSAIWWNLTDALYILYIYTYKHCYNPSLFIINIHLKKSLLWLVSKRRRAMHWFVVNVRVGVWYFYRLKL